MISWANAHTWICCLRENYLNSFKVLPFGRNIFAFYLKSFRCFTCKGAVVLSTLPGAHQIWWAPDFACDRRDWGWVWGRPGGRSFCWARSQNQPRLLKISVTKVLAQRPVFREIPCLQRSILRREPSVSIRKKYPLEPRVLWKWKNVRNAYVVFQT